MPKKKSARENETLIGIVTPVKWDEDDRVTAVALCATDDEQYLIENGEQFIYLIQKSIQATGVVSRDAKPSRSIAIRDYCILESF